jgi:hypothetical protein
MRNYAKIKVRQSLASEACLVSSAGLQSPKVFRMPKQQCVGHYRPHAYFLRQNLWRRYTELFAHNNEESGCVVALILAVINST